MVSDFRKVLDGAAIRAGFSEPLIRRGEVVKDREGKPVLRSTVKTHMLRHSFTAARLQTLDHGAPVSVYTVARELGHGGDSLVKRIYGHLGELRHRADVLEYWVEQHEARVQERLTAMTDAGASSAAGQIATLQ